MKIADIAVNMICRVSIVIPDKDIKTIFDGYGIPRYYGFGEARLNTDWVKKFAENSYGTEITGFKARELVEIRLYSGNEHEAFKRGMMYRLKSCKLI